MNIKTYKIMRKYQLLRLVMFLIALIITNTVLAQVSGVIQSEDGLPLPGVNITILGTDIGTQSDFDGNYEINATPGQTISFSFIGFKSVEIEVKDSNTINVLMEEESESLDAVVISAFGRKVSRNESTASVSAISSEDIQRSVTSTDVRESLQGQVTGLMMNETAGTPGAEPEIRIRGQNSITAGNSPLYVIDGVPVNSGNQTLEGSGQSTLGVFSLINSADIESMTILKDASAVAPYGADGANGVILLTTKKGTATRMGDTQFSINTSIAIRNDAIKGPTPMNAETRALAIREAAWNTFGNGKFGNGTLTSRDQLDDYIINNLNPNYGVWIDDGRPNYDWRDGIRKKNALETSVNFSVAKNAETSHFYGSLGLNKTDGTTIGTELQRISGSLNYGTKFFNDKFDFNISAHVGNVRQTFISEEGGTSASFSNPNYAKYTLSTWVPPFNDDGSYRIKDFRTLTGKPNPFYLFEGGGLDNTNKITRVLQNTSLGIDITDNLRFQTVLGLDYTINEYKNYADPIHGNDTAHGSETQATTTNYTYTTQNSLDYTFNLSEKNHFRITAVQEFTKYKDKLLRGSGENFPSTNLRNLSASTANWTADATYSDLAKLRYVGLLNYDFDRRYVLDASYSYQGDSRFSKKFDSFYSLGLAWNITEENFLRNSHIIDDLHLRVGYGRTGNANIKRNQFQQLVSYDTYRNAPAAQIDVFGTDATWEKSDRIDFGLEYILFDGRLSGLISYYTNKTKDMLLQVPIPLTTGFYDGIVLRNAGDMTNRGLELEIKGDIIRESNLKWSLGLNFSTLRNRVGNIPEDAEVTGIWQAIHRGHKVNEWYMPDWAGVDPENGLPLWYVDRDVSDETTSKYSEAKRKYQGTNPLPTYYGTFSTRFEYGNFFLDASLYFVGGNSIYEFKKEFYRNTAGSNLETHNPQIQTWTEAWKEPGDIADYPRWDYSNAVVDDAASAHSTRFLHDATFMRLKNVGLGYHFEKDLIRELGLDELTLSVRGKNLWTWVKDKDLEWDPETRTTGMTSMATPPVKSIIFSMNLKF